MKLMESCDCCYLIPLDAEGKETNLALQVSSKDKYAPKKTGVYNIGLKEFDKANTAQ